MKRTTVGFLAGCLIGLVPRATLAYFQQHHVNVPPWFVNAATGLSAPGILAGLALNRNVHLVNPWLVGIVNFVFYFALGYLLWTYWQKRHGRSVA